MWDHINVCSWIHHGKKTLLHNCKCICQFQLAFSFQSNQSGMNLLVAMYAFQNGPRETIGNGIHNSNPRMKPEINLLNNQDQKLLIVSNKFTDSNSNSISILTSFQLSPQNHVKSLSIPVSP